MSSPWDKLLRVTKPFPSSNASSIFRMVFSEWRIPISSFCSMCRRPPAQRWEGPPARGTVTDFTTISNPVRHSPLVKMVRQQIKNGKPWNRYSASIFSALLTHSRRLWSRRPRAGFWGTTRSPMASLPSVEPPAASWLSAS